MEENSESGSREMTPFDEIKDSVSHLLYFHIKKNPAGIIMALPLLIRQTESAFGRVPQLWRDFDGMFQLADEIITRGIETEEDWEMLGCPVIDLFMRIYDLEAAAYLADEEEED